MNPNGSYRWVMLVNNCPNCYADFTKYTQDNKNVMVSLTDTTNRRIALIDQRDGTLVNSTLISALGALSYNYGTNVLMDAQNNLLL